MGRMDWRRLERKLEAQTEGRRPRQEAHHSRADPVVEAKAERRAMLGEP